MGFWQKKTLLQEKEGVLQTQNTLVNERKGAVRPSHNTKIHTDHHATQGPTHIHTHSLVQCCRQHHHKAGRQGTSAPFPAQRKGLHAPAQC
jgi:hypothetical protein